MLIMTSQWLIGLVYFFAAFLLIFGLWRMSSPVTAAGGIHVAGWGMAAAVIVSFLYVFSVSEAARPHLPVNVSLALVALLLGGGAAWWSGRKAAMTAMPQMVAIYNGMGGGAAAAIAAMELFGGRVFDLSALAGTLFGALIGAISLSGSLIAWARLDGRINKPLHMKGLQLINALLMLVTLCGRRLADGGHARRTRFVERRAVVDRCVLRLRAVVWCADDVAHRRCRHAGGHLPSTMPSPAWRSAWKGLCCRFRP